MGFMQLEICQGDVYIVDTTYGMECVPADVFSGEPDAQDLRDYVDGEIISFERVSDAYYGRTTAPGYMDSTDWCWSDTLRGLLDALAVYCDGDDDLEAELAEWLERAGS